MSQSRSVSTSILTNAVTSPGGTTIAGLQRLESGGLRSALIEAVMDELRARSEGGGLIAGFPLMKLRVSVLGGEAQEIPFAVTVFSLGPPIVQVEVAAEYRLVGDPVLEENLP